MKPNVKRMRNGRDKFTGLKYAKTSRRTLKVRGNSMIQEDLFWRELDEELKD